MPAAEPPRQSGELARFQDAFAQALFAGREAAGAQVAALVAQPAFAVYRNTVVKACVDALLANYPAVARITGDDWFRAAAAMHVREAPPVTPMLLEYGGAFVDFLRRFEPASDMPYLPDVARLDRCWTEAHVAQSQAPVEAAAVAALSPEALGKAVLQPHAAARWVWFDSGPIFTLWSRNRVADPAAMDFDWKPEGALLVRPRDAVRWLALDAGGCAFMDACAAGRPLAEAAQAALDVQPEIDLRETLATLLAAGAFGRLQQADIQWCDGEST